MSVPLHVPELSSGGRLIAARLLERHRSRFRTEQLTPATEAPSFFRLDDERAFPARSVGRGAIAIRINEDIAWLFRD